jgi:hypothetical protein
MADIVNLRRARKEKARQQASKDAAAKRAKFGRSRAERDAADMLRTLEENRLDSHRREAIAADDRAE